MDLQLVGKKALVTGASRGIGRAIAERLAAEGADVAICARSAGAVEDAVKSLKSKGVAAWGSSVDVRDTAELSSWVEGAAAALGGIDILVANAGALSFGLSSEAFHSALDVDLIHTVTAVEAAMPHIEQSRSGSIVAIGSTGGVEDSELNSYASVSYGAIKAALHFYIKSLARTVAPKGNTSQRRKPRFDILRRRRLGSDQKTATRALRQRGQNDSNGPHGAPRRNRQRRGVHREPGCELRHRFESRG
jgi:NAD(P)-dependent dehydrogenase (short-subunit alcohol dehydrogenase family)